MSRSYTFVVASTLAALVSAVPASAQSLHTVKPGDTLWSIAAANNFTTRALAAANGLPEDSLVLTGQTIQIPTQTEAAAALAGPALDLTTGSPAPLPTQETMSPSLVQQAALEHGVSPSLAAAIAEQESGFNNAFISSADARGVMQITPSAWQFVQSNLAAYPLEPASARENVHAGVLYLARLLRDTRDELTATAAYYQGLSSVRAIGLLPETRTYVESVMALRSRYGG